MLTLKLLQHNIRCIATKLKNYVKLNDAGQIATEYLPSYVDDVLEIDSLSAAPNPGEKGKIYTALDTNKVYRWSGSSYIEIQGGDPAWGTITGTLTDQADLKAKFDGITLDQVATNSGSSPLNDYQILVKATGAVEHRNWNVAPVAGAFVTRTTTGAVRAADPVNADECTTKSYVDSSINSIQLNTLFTNANTTIAANRVLALNGSLAPVSYPFASIPTANSFMVRDPSGRSQIVDPSADSDIATKRYVDGVTILDTVSQDGKNTTNGSLNFESDTYPNRLTTYNQSGVTFKAEPSAGSAGSIAKLTFDGTTYTNYIGYFASSGAFKYWYIGATYATAVVKINNLGLNIGGTLSIEPSFQGIELSTGYGIKNNTIKSSLISTDANGVFKGVDLSSISPIADPSTATTEDIATAFNNLLSALKA